MKNQELKRFLIVLSGFVFISISVYIYYPTKKSQILYQQPSNVSSDSDTYFFKSNTKNIVAKIKTYFQSLTLNQSTSEDNTFIGPDAVNDLSPEDIFDLSLEDERPRPSVVPVTSNKEECLPTIKGLQFQPVNEQDCHQPHVLMNAGGRLGNQLCQYASLFLLRHLYGVRVAIKQSMRSNLGRIMNNISLPIQESGCFSNNITNLKYDAMYMTIYMAAKDAITNKTNQTITTNLLKKSYYVWNGPGPRALLMDHRDLVRSILSFKEDVISRAIQNIDNAIKPYNATYNKRDFHIVSVHVRRTDYTGYIKGKFNLTELNQVYFTGAFDFYKKRLKKTVFLVMSDDRAWCRVNLAAQDVVIMNWAPTTIDMATASLADHHITSYGTYSFMGALLGHGHITHPLGHNRRYKLVDCVNSPYFHYISRDKTYEIDNSHVQLI